MQMIFRHAVVALAASLSTGVACANDLFNFTTVQDTDWTEAGLGGLRGTGTGAITLAGITGTVSKAYLYWHGPTSSSDPNANAGVSFAGTGIVGTQIGFSDDNFWNFDNSQAYRADVTSLVSGNGSYTLAGFRKGTTVEINGASLIVFFDDGNSTNNRDVVLFNGNDANWPNPFDAIGWNTTLSGINYSGGSASIHFHVSDGQDFAGADDGNLTLNGTSIANGDIFNGSTTPFAAGGVSNGKLWDIRSFDATSFLTAGPNSFNIQLNNVTDALSLVAVAIDLPAGAAPPIPEPGTWALMLAGLAGVGWTVRRRKA
jgi:hypothetical protein